MKDEEKLIQNIVKIRSSKGLTKRRMAEALNLNEASYGRIENVGGDRRQGNGQGQILIPIYIRSGWRTFSPPTSLLCQLEEIALDKWGDTFFVNCQF